MSDWDLREPFSLCEKHGATLAMGECPSCMAEAGTIIHREALGEIDLTVRFLTRLDELEAELERVRLIGRETGRDPLTEKCPLCHVAFSTEGCQHLLDLSDGRVVLSREVWEALVEDRLRLREVLNDDE